jgi:hypothetical protein
VMGIKMSILGKYHNNSWYRQNSSKDAKINKQKFEMNKVSHSIKVAFSQGFLLVTMGK